MQARVLRITDYESAVRFSKFTTSIMKNNGNILMVSYKLLKNTYTRVSEIADVADDYKSVIRCSKSKLTDPRNLNKNPDYC